ncbi:CCR4-NOT transcription complex subunit 2 [Aphanomyces cochlioides]|nr:CCR4-NOT transcription complex subunit 2 [Aphanomyces cochlioides]KAG9398306.1 CCR4-NOT transcription complex subunit 2 [Aphanomyces cochlioides]
MSIVAGGGESIILPESAETRAVATVEAPTKSTTMTDLPPHLVASINRINAALEVAVQQPPPATGTLRVCLATEEEWNAFADCDGEVVHLNYLEWFADSGEIHVIEFESTPHETYSDELNVRFQAPNIKRWLNTYLTAKNSQGPRTCPDLSYGPHPRTPGAVLPPEIPIFTDFGTIKIEIGVSQSWGRAPGQLDHKAIEIWANTPGVEHVLCVKFDPDFENAEYKLYEVRVNLDDRDPLPIAAPRTIVQFDGRRILGIPQGMPLPLMQLNHVSLIRALNGG